MFDLIHRPVLAMAAAGCPAGWVKEIAICFRAYLHQARAMADAGARVMSAPHYRDQVCGDLAGALIRANILVDLWRANPGPCRKTLVTGIYYGDIHRDNPRFFVLV